MKLLRYDHGFKPFFIDLTIDGCQFMRNRNHQLAKILYHIIRDYTNMNHTCPFDVSREKFQETVCFLNEFDISFIARYHC